MDIDKLEKEFETESVKKISQSEQLLVNDQTTNPRKQTRRYRKRAKAQSQLETEKRMGNFSSFLYENNNSEPGEPYRSSSPKRDQNTYESASHHNMAILQLEASELRQELAELTGQKLNKESSIEEREENASIAANGYNFANEPKREQNTHDSADHYNMASLQLEIRQLY